MSSKKPLMTRIVIAFVLMTAVFSGLFSLSIVLIVHVVEEHLVTQGMQDELAAALHSLSAEHPLRLMPGTRLYSDGARFGKANIPARYADLEPGFTEVLKGGRAVYAFTKVLDGQRLVLVKEQDSFEARERTLFTVVLVGFVLTVLGALAFGWQVARRVMVPVSQLAKQVQTLDDPQMHLRPLAMDYAADEIGQLASAFDSAFSKIREMLEREQLFTGDVSHELRTPLMVVSTSCEVLRQTELTNEQLEQVVRIERVTLEMRNLVQTFLLLARGNSTEASSEERQDLAVIAERQYRYWQPAMADKGLAFDLVVEAEDSVGYNAVYLSRILFNLLQNAHRYTDTGEVRLTIGNGWLRVEDTGQPIPSAQHAAIFDLFFRGEGAVGDGLGLGLSLVKRICQAKGWSVEVSTQEPRGNCFLVRLAPA